MRFCCAFAVTLLTFLTPCVHAGSSWFDDFDNGTLNWTAADGKTSGTADPARDYNAVPTTPMSMRVEQLPAETRPQHTFTFAPDLVGSHFYDDGSTTKTFRLEVRGIDALTLEATTVSIGMTGTSSTYALMHNGAVSDTRVPRQPGWHRFVIHRLNSEIQFSVDGARFTRGLLAGTPTMQSVVFRSDSPEDPTAENRVWVDHVEYQNGPAAAANFRQDRWFITPHEVTTVPLSRPGDVAPAGIALVANTDADGGFLQGGYNRMPISTSGIDPANNTALAPDGNPLVVNRASNNSTWTFSTEGLTGYTCDVILPLAEVTGVANPLRLVVLTRPDSTFPWRALDTEYDAQDNVLIARGLTSFSDFAIGSNTADGNTLPVSLSGLSLE